MSRHNFKVGDIVRRINKEPFSDGQFKKKVTNIVNDDIWHGETWSECDTIEVVASPKKAIPADIITVGEIKPINDNIKENTGRIFRKDNREDILDLVKELEEAKDVIEALKIEREDLKKRLQTLKEELRAKALHGNDKDDRIERLTNNLGEKQLELEKVLEQNRSLGNRLNIIRAVTEI